MGGGSSVIPEGMEKVIEKANEQLEDVARAGHPRFYQILADMAELHDKKNQDYTGDQGPLANLQMCEMFGVPAWVGTLIRMSDKWSRIVSLANKDEAAVKDESIEDTLMDLAIYSILCMILRQERKEA